MARNYKEIIAFLLFAAIHSFYISLNNTFAQMHTDIVFVNGRIWTVDKSQPQAEAVAAHESIIVAVGSSSEIKKFITDSTKVID
ncbi:MAG: hypothetical protein HY800_00275, partial [Ignavibacteriales bacterium]|nr:hypothetical protein [Ignavibacteriales bacterium]